ncbi:MAG: hypothetical protein IJ137_09685, partial [Eubacterium sp.]|nr:hypothetical protein [Eubacterium sp.]
LRFIRISTKEFLIQRDYVLFYLSFTCIDHKCFYIRDIYLNGTIQIRFPHHQIATGRIEIVVSQAENDVHGPCGLCFSKNNELPSQTL